MLVNIWGYIAFKFFYSPILILQVQQSFIGLKTARNTQNRKTSKENCKKDVAPSVPTKNQHQSYHESACAQQKR